MTISSASALSQDWERRMGRGKCARGRRGCKCKRVRITPHNLITLIDIQVADNDHSTAGFTAVSSVGSTHILADEGTKEHGGVDNREHGGVRVLYQSEGSKHRGFRCSPRSWEIRL